MSTAWRNGLMVSLMVSVLFMLNTTPAAALPTLPAPELCQVEPRSAENVFELTASPPPERSDADEIEWDDARAANDEEIAAITTLFLEFIACLNSGDYLRQAALVSDEFLVRGFVSDIGLELPDELQVRYEGMYGTYMFGDGRLGAVVVTSTPAEFAPLQPHFVFFKWQGDRWLIDDVPPSGVTVQVPQ